MNSMPLHPAGVIPGPGGDLNGHMNSSNISPSGGAGAPTHLSAMTGMNRPIYFKQSYDSFLFDFPIIVHNDHIFFRVIYLSLTHLNDRFKCFFIIIHIVYHCSFWQVSTLNITHRWPAPKASRRWDKAACRNHWRRQWTVPAMDPAPGIITRTRKTIRAHPVVQTIHLQIHIGRHIGRCMVRRIPIISRHE